MKTIGVLVLTLLVGLGGAVFAQGQAAAPAQKPPAAQAPQAQPPAAQPPAAQPPAAPKPKPRPAAPSRMSLTVFVTDPTGAPQQGVKVTADGPVPREGTTTREGSVVLQGLRGGTYRLRFEADRFVTFEKEVTVKGGSEEIEVTMTRAATPPKPVEPEPAPKPAPSAAAPLPPADPSATIAVVSVVDWLAKNRLERGEPRKEGVVARTPLQSSALLQVRDALRDRSHPDADEVIYVINGSAVLSSKGRDQKIETGALVVIPRGVSVTIENRGREPLWALSVLTPGAKP
jgi:mannose-6-phosphate isomerase-like protein (cupin superfamily)